MLLALIRKFLGEKGVYVFLVIFCVILYYNGINLNLLYRVFILLIPMLVYKVLGMHYNGVTSGNDYKEGRLVKLIEKGYIKRGMLEALFFVLLLMPGNGFSLILMCVNYNGGMLRVFVLGNLDIFFKKYFNIFFFKYFHKFLCYIGCYVNKILDYLFFYTVYRFYFLMQRLKAGYQFLGIGDIIYLRFAVYVTLYMLLLVLYKYQIEVINLGYGGLFYRILVEVVSYMVILPKGVWLLIIIYVDLNIIVMLFFFLMDLFEKKEQTYYSSLSFIYPRKNYKYTSYFGLLYELSLYTSLTYLTMLRLVKIINYKYDGYFYKKYGIITSILPRHGEMILLKFNSRSYILNHFHMIQYAERCYGHSNYIYYNITYYNDIYQKAIFSEMLMDQININVKTKDGSGTEGVSLFYVFMSVLSMLMTYKIAYNMNMEDKNFFRVDAKNEILQKSFNPLIERRLSFKVLKNKVIMPDKICYLYYDAIPTKFMSNKLYKDILKEYSFFSLLNYDDNVFTGNESLNEFIKKIGGRLSVKNEELLKDSSYKNYRLIYKYEVLGFILFAIIHEFIKMEKQEFFNIIKFNRMLIDDHESLKKVYMKLLSIDYTMSDEMIKDIFEKELDIYVKEMQQKFKEAYEELYNKNQK